MSKVFDILPVFEFEGGSSRPEDYQASGHHDPVVFAAALLYDWGRYIDSGKVRHEWRRKIPTPSPYYSDRWVMIITEAAGPGRGIYPVTIADEQDTAAAEPWPRRFVASVSLPDMD